MPAKGRARLFARYAFEKRCVARSLKVALVVGTVLALINHFDSMVSASLGVTETFQIILTYAVPYSVSSFGFAMQAAQMERDARTGNPDPTSTPRGPSELSRLDVRVAPDDIEAWPI